MNEDSMLKYYKAPQENELEVPEPITRKQDTSSFSWKQQGLNTMEKAFKSRYKFFDKAGVEMVDSILNTDNCIKVPGITIALEITKQNQSLTNKRAPWLFL